MRVCEEVISAAFNSLFPMITTHIYHTGQAASACVSVRGRAVGIHSWSDEYVGGKMAVCLPHRISADTDSDKV